MITPRRTRVLRVADLRTLQRALAAVACPPDPARARSCAVILPTIAAAAELRLTLENLLLLSQPAGGAGGRHAFVLPDLLTRAGWYARMHERLAEAPPLLSTLERDVIAHAAARVAIAEGLEPPFRLRAGLVTELLALYDDLRRHRRTVEAFERLMTGELEPRVEIDRGADRLLRQTRFLAAAFRAYERRRDLTGRLDEHALRDLLLSSGGPGAYRHLVVAVGDRASEETGLFAADYDLITRLPGLDAVDVIATEEAFGSGLGERLREALPEVEEVRWADEVPAASPAVHAVSTSRDREDELAGVARRLKAAHRNAGTPGSCPPVGRTAVVFRRPLPYVYLAQTVLGSAGVPFQVVDALPLAAEPYAAALDLVCTAVTSAFRRAAVTALLACPHFVFECDGRPVGRDAVLAFDRAMLDAGFLGGSEELSNLTASLGGPAGQAARAAGQVAAGLGPLASPARASEHLGTLLAFVRRHERRVRPDDPVWERHQRARTAILTASENLRAAHLQHDDPVVSFADLTSTLRRWIEDQTFSPRWGTGGVHLVDARAAAFGDYDEVFLVGLVDGDWPGGSSPNIFYPSTLLAQLGWPPEPARRAGTRAAFTDLVNLARDRVTISTFSLEDDALVAPSSLLDDLGLQAEPPGTEALGPPVRVFIEEGLTTDPIRSDGLPDKGRDWLEARRARTPAGDPRFHGQAGPVELASWSVTAVDVYIECPFKFFATFVLELGEELEDEEGVTPRERGKFVHDVLRVFYAEWQQRGGNEITPENLGEARRLYEELAATALEGLPTRDRATERAVLLGSAVGRGAGEIVLTAEAASPWPVSERLLELRFDDTFELTGSQGARRFRLRGAIDRIDLLSDNCFRLVDYKTGRAPDWRRSVQLPIYSTCASQALHRTKGGAWEVFQALYLVLAGRDNVRVAIPADKGRLDALAGGQQRFLDAVDGIERGAFPPRPAETRLCRYCRFATVCRKEFAGGD